ncbi:MAG TPA: UvrD-helicase domain-containing protein [Bacteroidota bacterium]|nr:UvrD-helicase domain-containing protein [Bacteroidota bacterium]
MSFLNDLNPVQREAAECVGGPLLVLAGPGSGKTRVLTYRIAHLLSLGVPPWKILSLTFTNKAAGEMRDRILKLVGDNGLKIWMGTFHSMFARIMRIDGAALGYGSNFTIYDAADSQGLMKNIQQHLGVPPQQFSTAGLQSRISSAKNQLIDPDSYAAAANDLLAEKTAVIYAEYEKQLRWNNALDFDDLLVRPIDLFRRHPAILEKYADRFHFVLVDEYQDTNRAQYVLLRLLVGKRRNICAVGDDAQSIYSFRGADIRNILEFEKDFPEAKVVRLEQNYRSTGTILSAADHVIRRNRDRLAKNLWTENPGGEPVTVMTCDGDREEAAVIVGAIFDEVRSRQLDFRDFAVMYRTNAQSRVLEDALRRNAIPYRLIGGVEFYQRKEIKDVLAYLRLVVNPADNESFNRIVNVPVRGAGDAALERVRGFAASHGTGLLDAARNCSGIAGLGKRALAGISSFVRLIDDHRKIVREMSAGEFTRVLVDALGFLPSLREEGTPEATGRWENIHELLSALTEYSETRPDPTLENFLQEVSLLSSVDRSDDGKNAVTLLTLHAAKGLEFPVVFITGMEEGILPLYNGGEPDRKEIEEERRLCYVGMTRAKHRLYCSNARVRHRFGEYLTQVPSRFLGEIPQELSRTLPSTMGPGHAPAGGSAPRKIHPKRRPAREEGWYHTDPDVDLAVYASDAGELKPGILVEHEQFGRGKIVEIEYAGESTRAVVEFRSHGLKHLILKYARLRIV